MVDSDESVSKVVLLRREIVHFVERLVTVVAVFVGGLVALMEFSPIMSLPLL